MKKLLLVLVMFPLFANATGTGKSCAKIDIDTKRLECYDSIFRIGKVNSSTESYTGSIKPFRSQSNLTSSSSPKLTKSTLKPKKTSSRTSYGGSCPCSGSIDCVGPRGGTYCFTSSGSKRYR